MKSNTTEHDIKDGDITPIHLVDDYYICVPGNTEEFWDFFHQNYSSVFDGRYNLRLNVVLTQEELDAVKQLAKNTGIPYRLNLYIMKGEERIGWFTGHQQDSETFYMRNTGILKEHQNKGIYSRFLRTLLEILRAKGFQKVSSRHHVANNQVIVPKLKAGFVITGLELNEMFGTLVHLHYYFNEKRKYVLDYRSGFAALDENTITALSYDVVTKESLKEKTPTL